MKTHQFYQMKEELLTLNNTDDWPKEDSKFTVNYVI